MSEKHTKPLSTPKARTTKGKTDWERVDRLSDEDIRAAVARDPDTFIADDEWFKTARVVFPETKEVVTLRLDPDVLEWFKAQGRGYQTRINAVLRAFFEAHKGGRAKR